MRKNVRDEVIKLLGERECRETLNQLNPQLTQEKLKTHKSHFFRSNLIALGQKKLSRQF